MSEELLGVMFGPKELTHNDISLATRFKKIQNNFLLTSVETFMTELDDKS